MNYVTLFDSDYLIRGIAMINSLLRYIPDSKVSVLCLDRTTNSIMESNYERHKVTTYCLDDLDTELVRQLQSDRSYREMCWTLGSVFSNFVMRIHCDEVVYLDADLFFFNNPKHLIEESRSGDVAAIRHRFPRRTRYYESNGVFNVQWVYFANTEIGRAASEKWAKQCIECCRYSPSEGLYGDQKYLDEWPHIYNRFVDISLVGAGVAPWNVQLTKPKKIGSTWKVADGSDLIFYHFHSLKQLENGKIRLAEPMYNVNRFFPIDLYREYLSELLEIQKCLHVHSDINTFNFVEIEPRRFFVYRFSSIVLQWLGWLRK